MFMVENVRNTEKKNKDSTAIPVATVAIWGLFTGYWVGEAHWRPTTVLRLRYYYYSLLTNEGSEVEICPNTQSWLVVESGFEPGSLSQFSTILYLFRFLDNTRGNATLSNNPNLQMGNTPQQKDTYCMRTFQKCALSFKSYHTSCNSVNSSICKSGVLILGPFWQPKQKAILLSLLGLRLPSAQGRLWLAHT